MDGHLSAYRKEELHAVFFGDYSQVSKPVLSCASAVNDEMYQTFFIRKGGECFAGPEMVEEFYRVKRSSKCSNGVGEDGAIDVYFFANRDGKR